MPSTKKRGKYTGKKGIRALESSVSVETRIRDSYRAGKRANDGEGKGPGH